MLWEAFCDGVQLADWITKSLNRTSPRSASKVQAWNMAYKYASVKFKDPEVSLALGATGH